VNLVELSDELAQMGPDVGQFAGAPIIISLVIELSLTEKAEDTRIRYGSSH